MKRAAYVLVTPVRNEDVTIGSTIESVVQQTITPQEWIIVSDGSVDRTDEIVDAYAARNSFIRLVRLEQRPGRSFSSVVFATEAGIAAIQTKQFEFLGLLDGDVRFEPAYYEKLLSEFWKDPRLGLAGGLVSDFHNGRRHRNLQTLRDVAGAVQFFRRECFESLGGLVALPEGGWDAITCVQARMNGFKTRTFPDLNVDHLKPRNIAEGNTFKRFRQLGIREYAVGNHPIFEFAKCGYRCLERPFVIGGMMRLVGYVSCCLERRKRRLSPELVAYLRQEQMGRLLALGKLTGSKARTVDNQRF
jgi:poly-beta-1,6-N-acetyl-D-glucosamine synthase